MLHKPFVIGIAGRSGSGKSTLVRNICSHFGEQVVTAHTMDNYYRERSEQLVDPHGYKNFDLPSSFYREKFTNDLSTLISGQPLHLPKYDFNKCGDTGTLSIQPAPIILVEGLFIYAYSEIAALLDYKIMVVLSLEEAFQRRLKRDQVERNYEEAEIRHRYFQHAEPAYQSFIHPHMDQMDLLVENKESLESGQRTIIEKLTLEVDSVPSMHDPQ